jgi:uncharacterized protein
MVLDHCAKLHPFIENSRSAAVAVNGLGGIFPPIGASAQFAAPCKPLFALRYGEIYDNIHIIAKLCKGEKTTMAIDDKTRTELEAAAFRRLVEHLRSRSDVQNIDLMNLAGFCRNCLSNWLKEAADTQGAPMTKDESREAIYGMPYETWKSKYQETASAEQLAALKKSHPGH